MKTSQTHFAANNTLGSLLLLSLLGTVLLSINFSSITDLATAFESQWLSFSNWMSGFMAHPLPSHW